MEWFKVYPAVITNPKYYRLSETGRGLLLHLWISAANEGAIGELSDEYWDCESLFMAAGVRPENYEHAKGEIAKIHKFGWFELTETGRWAPKNWDLHQACPLSPKERKRFERSRKTDAKILERHEVSAMVVTDNVTHVTGEVLPCIALPSLAGIDPPIVPQGGFELSAVAEKPKRAREPKRGTDCHPDARRLAEYLLEQILVSKPDFKVPTDSAFEGWVREMDHTVRLDDRDPDRVAEVIHFATRDESFWSGVILSAKSLRKGFDRIEKKMAAVEKNPTRTLEPRVDYPDLAVVGKAEGWYRETTTKKLSITGENC